ncbi:MAG: hypothetical protein H0Z38_06690 [Firmicutes bacterium]|nr:hypothetical protein [Bacillota bacterium]
MDVLILKDSTLPDPNANRLQTEILARNLVCRQLLFSRIMVEVDGKIRFFYEDKEIKPKVVVNWLKTRDYRGFEMLKAFEAEGIQVINRAEPWWISGSGFLISLILHQHGLLHPYSWHAPSGPGIASNRSRLEPPLIHMPSGTIGHSNLVYLKDDEAVRIRLQAFRNSQKDLDLQKAREAEYLGLVQVIVLEGKALVAWTNGRPRSQVTSLGQMMNRYQRRRMALLNLDDNFTQKAERAAQAVGLDFCAVNLYQYPDRWEIAGLTACPSFKEVEDGFGYNIAEKVGEISF